MNKIKIWGESIPFNSGRSKKDYLAINSDISPSSAMAAVFRIIEDWILLKILTRRYGIIQL